MTLENCKPPVILRSKNYPRIISYLQDHPTTYIRDIARNLNMSNNNTLVLVYRLADHGTVSLRKSHKDLRAVFVELSCPVN